MDYLSNLLRIIPSIRIINRRKTIVLMNKVNVADLEVCQPKIVTREMPFWRTDKVDIYRALADGSVRHTPSD
jgi:hypothetical protein